MPIAEYFARPRDRACSRETDCATARRQFRQALAAVAIVLAVSTAVLLAGRPPGAGETPGRRVASIAPEGPDAAHGASPFGALSPDIELEPSRIAAARRRPRRCSKIDAFRQKMNVAERFGDDFSVGARLLDRHASKQQSQTSGL